MPTVIVAGGGTGGHIFPGIAIARALAARVPGCEVVFVGTERGLESRIVPAEGFRLMTIRSAGIAGRSPAARARGLALIPLSLVQSLRILARTRPGLVIGVGGYASGPVLVAAVLRRVPTLIHEQNFVPGTTNRWIAPWVTQVVVTFEETIGLLRGRGVALGNPVRAEFATVAPRPHGLPFTSLLIFGGSQGARILNRTICAALPRLAGLRGRLRVTHQTGEADHESVTRAWRDAGFTPQEARVAPFIREMARAFEEADLVVARSGATTVAELTAAGRPALLVPFAGATHDHQAFNARKLADAGAASLLLEKDLNADSLAAAIIDLTADPSRLQEMAAASRRLGRPEAASRIAEVCEGLLAGRRAA